MANVHFTQNLARHTECPSAALAADTVAELLERYFESWLVALGVDPGEVDRLARETVIPAGCIAPAREV